MKVFVYLKKFSKRVAIFTNIREAKTNGNELTLIAEDGSESVWDIRTYKVSLFQN